MIKQGDTIINVRTGQKMIFLKTWLETNGTHLQIECVSPVTKAREPLHVHRLYDICLLNHKSQTNEKMRS